MNVGAAMTSRSKRMSVVQRVAGMREQDAARELGSRLQDLRDEQLRLQQLSRYQLDYRELMLRQGQQGLSAERFRNFGEFLGQMDGMIESQRQRILQAEQRVASARQHWLALRGREQAVAKLVDRFRAEEDYQAGRREQAEADDRVLQPGAGD